jgi:aspartate 1-decarboxylase
MIRAFLRSKIHRATVTHVDVDYEGSLSLDEDLMTAAGLWPYERVEIWNVSNGERFSTYIICGEKGSRQIKVFGAAGRQPSALALRARTRRHRRDQEDDPSISQSRW